MKTVSRVIFISLFSTLFLLSLAAMKKKSFLEKKTSAAINNCKKYKDTPLKQKYVNKLICLLYEIDTTIAKKAFDEEYSRSRRYLKMAKKAFGGEEIFKYLSINFQPGKSPKTCKYSLGELVYFRDIVECERGYRYCLNYLKTIKEQYGEEIFAALKIEFQPGESLETCKRKYSLNQITTFKNKVYEEVLKRAQKESHDPLLEFLIREADRQKKLRWKMPHIVTKPRMPAN